MYKGCFQVNTRPASSMGRSSQKMSLRTCLFRVAAIAVCECVDNALVEIGIFRICHAGRHLDFRSMNDMLCSTLDPLCTGFRLVNDSQTTPYGTPEARNPPRSLAS